MQVDDVIVLDNDAKCLLIEKAALENVNYFLAIVLDDEEKPTEESIVLKESIEDGDTYVEKVSNENTLKVLLEKFSKKAEELLQEVDEENLFDDKE